MNPAPLARARSAFLPQFAIPLARASGVAHPESWGAPAVVFSNVGAILGYVASGFVVDALGRRWLVATFGGVSRAALYRGTAYLLGLVMLPFLHETKDEPLPP